MIKKIIKKIPFSKNIIGFVKNKLMYFQFLKDASFYEKNYMLSKNKTINKIQYNIILNVHSIEKGMSCSKMRPFGVDKIKTLIELLKEYDKIEAKSDFAYNLGYSTLNKYKDIYEKNNWNDKNEYIIVKKFLEIKNEYKEIPVGSFEYIYNDYKKYANIDYQNFVNSRHSVRNFSSKSLLDKDIKQAVEIAIKSPSACNRQMCKIYYAKKDTSKNIIEQYAQGLTGFDLSNINYFIITFDINSNYFVGDRNQGWFNAGLIAMNFVNGLHSLGIGSCFIQFANSYNQEKKIKKELNIPTNERIAVILAVGYYAETSKIPYSSRKNVNDIYFER